MNPETIGVLEGPALAEFVRILMEAKRTGRKVRVCVDGGVKCDAGGVTGGWTAPMGRLADVTGH